MTDTEQDFPNLSKKRLVLIFLVFMLSIPIFFWLLIQVTSLVPRAFYSLDLFIVALMSWVFTMIVVYIMFKIAFRGHTAYAWIEKRRTWLFLSAFVGLIAFCFPSFEVLYSILFPTLDSEIRQTLPGVTILAILIIISVPPLRSRTKRLFEKALGFHY